MRKYGLRSCRRTSRNRNRQDKPKRDARQKQQRKARHPATDGKERTKGKRGKHGGIPLAPTPGFALPLPYCGKYLADKQALEAVKILKENHPEE